MSCNSRAMRVRSLDARLERHLETVVHADPEPVPAHSSPRRTSRAERAEPRRLVKRGAMENSSMSPVSFHTPLLFAAMTRKRYARGRRFEYCTWRSLMTSFQSRVLSFQHVLKRIFSGADEAERRVVDLHVAHLRWQSEVRHGGAAGQVLPPHRASADEPLDVDRWS